MKRIVIYFVFLLNFATVSGQSVDSLSVYYAANNLEKALEQSTQLIKQDSGKAETIVMHGRILVDLGRFSEGMNYLRKAITIDKDTSWISAWAWAYLGQANFMTSNYETSEKSLRHCIVLNKTKNVNQYATKRMFSFGFDDYFVKWQIVETAHLRFHIQTPFEIANIKEYTQQREDIFCNITKQLGVTLPKKIDFFVWNNSEEPRTKFGMNLGFASPEFVCVYAQKKQTKGHEITHVITHHIGKIKIKTGLINEGTAVFFNHNNDNKLENLRECMQNNDIERVSIRDTWEHWEKCNNEISYPLAGAFISEFVNKFGVEGLKKILFDQTYENAKKIFGNEIDELISNFESKVIITQSSLDTTLNDFITKIILEGNKKGQMTLSPIVLIDGEKLSIAAVQAMRLIPDQVKSISRLEGEAAIAVCGKKGVNGVLLVETKTGYKKNILKE